MLLEGSCHCSAISFSVECPYPVPYMRCYCSICRKTAGGGGYAINLGARFETLQVSGREEIRVYRARVEDPKDGTLTRSRAERSFCGRCGSALWIWDPRWPDLVHPLASAIDSDLPAAPEHCHIMLDSKPAWVPLERSEQDTDFARYPEESLAEWHHKKGLADDT